MWRKKFMAFFLDIRTPSRSSWDDEESTPSRSKWEMASPARSLISEDVRSERRLVHCLVSSRTHNVASQLCNLAQQQ